MVIRIADYIDHTILKPTTTHQDVERVCREALDNTFAAVCVPPYFVKQAATLLHRSTVNVATVIGFPFGYSTVEGKLAEIDKAILDGAHELDIVHNIAALKSGDWEFLEKEIEQCTNRIHAAGGVIKVIVESGLLSDEELVKCCNIYSRHHIDFMKTSTGYADIGATVHAVEMMRQHLPSNIAIKASGGIRSFAFAKQLVDAGATRIGCSASLLIVKESNE